MNNLARGLKGGNPSEWFNKNRVNIPSMKETIWQPLYDSAAITAAGTSSVTLFQDQIGKNGKTLTDTNMDLDGQLSSGTAFLVTGIQLAFYSGAESMPIPSSLSALVVQDTYQFANSGSLTFRIQSKDYCRQAPLGKFPPVERLAVDFAMHGDPAAFESIKYAAPSGREFSVRGLLLESSQNFSIELRDIAPMASGIDGRVVCTLNGFLGRNAQ